MKSIILEQQGIKQEIIRTLAPMFNQRMLSGRPCTCPRDFGVNKVMLHMNHITPNLSLVDRQLYRHERLSTSGAENFEVNSLSKL
jgi:hypothetical protein